MLPWLPHAKGIVITNGNNLFLSKFQTQFQARLRGVLSSLVFEIYFNSMTHNLGGGYILGGLLRVKNTENTVDKPCQLKKKYSINKQALKAK